MERRACGPGLEETDVRKQDIAYINDWKKRDKERDDEHNH